MTTMRMIATKMTTKTTTSTTATMIRTCQALREVLYLDYLIKFSLKTTL